MQSQTGLPALHWWGISVRVKSRVKPTHLIADGQLTGGVEGHERCHPGDHDGGGDSRHPPCPQAAPAEDRHFDGWEESAGKCW